LEKLLGASKLFNSGRQAGTLDFIGTYLSIYTACSQWLGSSVGSLFYWP